MAPLIEGIKNSWIIVLESINSKNRPVTNEAGFADKPVTILAYCAVIFQLVVAGFILKALF